MITRTALGWGVVKAPTANTNKGMVVHYDGSNQGLASKPCSACEEYWIKTRNHHMKGNQWIDIGYAYGVCPHGEIYVGRGFGRVQAAAKQTPGKLPNGNDRWVNVTLMGGPNDAVPDVQIKGFLKLRDSLMRDMGMGTDVKCHSDFTATSCPGNIARTLVRSGTFSRITTDPKEEKKVKPSEVWSYEIEVPEEWSKPDNREWQAKSLLLNANERIRSLETEIKSLHEKLDLLIGIAS